MALTIKDILELPSTRHFQLVAGAKGLDRFIVSAGIADYEFAGGLEYDSGNGFERDSLVISSLLFAKDAPEQILPAVRSMREQGVAAFAYKQVIYQELPQEVLEYANQEGLAIFAFRGEVWFENVIFDIMSAVSLDNDHYLSEENLAAMIRGEMEQVELDRIRRGISLNLDRSTSAVFLRQKGLDTGRVLRSYYMSKTLREKLLATAYEDGIFLLATSSKWDERAHRQILKEAVEVLGIPVPGASLMLSEIRPAVELDQVFREAYYGRLAEGVLGKHVRSYRDLGVCAAVLPLVEEPVLAGYAAHLMSCLTGYEDTLAAYVANGGDAVATSVDLGCHANTIRYRLGKMKEAAGCAGSTDAEFFRDLSVAYVVDRIKRSGDE